MPEESNAAVEAARAGSLGAFDALLQPLVDPAFRVAVLILGDPGQAEDAVQEAALRAWRKLGQYRGAEGGFRAWFLKIVANECRMVRRRSWWSVLPLAEDAEDARSLEEIAVGRLDVRRALARMSERDRLGLFLYYYLDLPIEEVARVLGVSVNGAKSRIHRALRRIRPGLELEVSPQ